MYYNALSPYLKARFGGKVYKLALSSVVRARTGTV